MTLRDILRILEGCTTFEIYDGEIGDTIFNGDWHGFDEIKIDPAYYDRKVISINTCGNEYLEFVV